MKKFLALVFVLCMVFSLCACGQQAAPAAESTAPAEESAAPADEVKDVTITVYHYMVQETKQAGLAAVESAFAAEHPELNITWDNVVYNQGTDYFPQLQTALASGDQPEIMMGNPGLYPDLVEQGFVADLSDNEVIKGLNLPAGDMGDVTRDGKVYGFPIDFKTWGVLYNKDIYAENGLEVPETYSQLLENCQALADAGIDPWIHAFGDAVFGDIEMRNYVWPTAVKEGELTVFEDIMSGEKKLTDYDFFRDALEQWGQRLAWMRDTAMTNNQNAALEEFISGKGAMLYFGSWGLGDLEAMIAGSDFEYGFFTMPQDDEGSCVLGVQVDQAFMVNPQSENYETALAFMEYWVTNGSAWSDVSLMPLLNGYVSDSAPQIVKDLAAAKSANSVNYGDFSCPWNSQFTTEWRNALTHFAETYANGNPETPDQCLAEMQAAFDQIIAEG